MMINGDFYLGVAIVDIASVDIALFITTWSYICLADKSVVWATVIATFGVI